MQRLWGKRKCVTAQGLEHGEQNRMVCEEVLQKRIGRCQTQQYPTVQGKTFGFCPQKNRKGEEFRHEHVYMVTDLSCKMRIYPKLGFPGNRF